MKNVIGGSDGLTESNFKKVTENVEKVELEFDYDDEVDGNTSKNILTQLRQHGDIGPDDSQYDLALINEFRRLPQY